MSFTKEDYERMRQRVYALNPHVKQPEIDPPRHLVSHPDHEQDPRHEPVAAVPREVARQGRVRILVTSYRCKLADDDGIQVGAKPLVDCLVAAGIIPSDSKIWCKIEHEQEQVMHTDYERTEMTIEPI